MKTTNIPETCSIPAPYGPLPSARQLKWHETPLYGFIHFTVNTFTGLEWGGGDESPEIFNPSGFDADQIVETAGAGGLEGLVLTCKHHDGFCLWPSKFTEHSVKNSPWRRGKGDVVRELSDACAKHKIKFGVYLSPWDRNRHDYGQASYIDYYRNQLKELLTGYGPLFEVWFDGANGGDGFYGGARETRHIDKRTYYDWENTWKIVRDLQPDACIFSDVGPDIRWVGNEKGIAGDPCWPTIDNHGWCPGDADTKILCSGCKNGGTWLPAECDVSIRPGWFYHPEEDEQVKSPDTLVDLYFQSVGRGCSLHLNLPPDKRGIIHEKDASSLAGFKTTIDHLFRKDHARAATASSPFPKAGQPHAAGCVNDGNPETFWVPRSDAASGEIILELPEPVRLEIIKIREKIALGKRVSEFAVDTWTNGKWNETVRAESIGSRRLLRIPPVETSKARFRIIQAEAAPAIQEIGLYQGGLWPQPKKPPATG